MILKLGLFIFLKKLTASIKNLRHPHRVAADKISIFIFVTRLMDSKFNYFLIFLQRDVDDTIKSEHFVVQWPIL